jgi:hypothetical protein
MPAIILPFTRHAGAPSSSNESMESRPPEALMIGSRHLCGTPRPGSRHFSTVRDFTPSDAAISSINCQSNVVLIAPHLSDKSSESQRQNDGRPNLLNCLRLVMADDADIENEEVAIRMRAKMAMKTYREAPTRKWSMREMAKFLHVTAKNYEAYEGKIERGVPISLIARFCQFAGEDINWILYGKRTRKVG